MTGSNRTSTLKRPFSLFLVLILICSGLLAEYVFFSPGDAFAVEISLENSTFDRLPIYRNAITSLEIIGDFAIGGTSAEPGLSPFLFAASLPNRTLESIVDLATVVPGQRELPGGFGRGPDGRLWAGTLPDQEGGSGHLIQVTLSADRLEVRDLGVPVPGEGVFSVAASPDGTELYGVTHPSGRFFTHNLRTSQTEVFEEAMLSRRTARSLHAYALEPRDVLSRRLVLDQRGRVYGSFPISKLFRFDPVKRSIDILPEELPQVWGRRPLGRVDSWALGPDGLLYGGNGGDGQLFTLDPESGKVVNLGKPIMMPRTTGLAFGQDGFLYGVAGATPGYAHLFRYELGGRGFVDLGNPRFQMKAPGIEQGIWWRGFQIGTVAASEDGKWIVLGETEALSQLMAFPVDRR